MNKSDVFVSVSNISVRKVDGKYSLYKPLLLLYVLSEYYSGKERLIQFSILNEQLSEIVNQYFAHTKYLNFHYAFGRLENDGIWENDGRAKRAGGRSVSSRPKGGESLSTIRKPPALEGAPGTFNIAYRDGTNKHTSCAPPRPSAIRTPLQMRGAPQSHPARNA